MSWCQNGIRQFLAIAIIMAGFPLLLKRKYVSLTVIILLGATFHASALLMVPIIFIVQGKAWNKKSVLCILGCILILIFVNRFTDGMNDALSNTQYSNIIETLEAELIIGSAEAYFDQGKVLSAAANR